MNYPRLTPEEAAARWREFCASRPLPAFAFYSSLFGGVVTDPEWMFAPADDHLVHRGDGVFETLRVVAGAVYAMGPHLDRLRASAEAIGLGLPMTPEGLTEAVVQTIRAAGRPDVLVRLIVSRGPGGWAVNPYESRAPQVYIAVYAIGRPFMELHPEGARVRTSRTPLKGGFLATIKTCNYIPNALMKKEAVDAGVDFTVAFDEQGRLAEGATENFGIVDADGILRTPPAERILAGVTMTRCAALAAAAPERHGLRGVACSHISRADIATAREALIFGTSCEVVSVVELDGRRIGDGRPGPVAAALWRSLRDDMLNNPAWRTPAF